jgi:methyl-accepting chemotaxis protein
MSLIAASVPLPRLLAAQAAEPLLVATRIDWLTTLSQVATVIIALCLLVVAAVMIPAAWNFRKLAVRLGQLAERLRDDAQPVLRHAEVIGENVGHVSTAIRRDVEGLHETVERANRRLDRLSAEAEARLRSFNALVKVVQEEAEDLFIGTASTVRGVRAGAEALSEPAADRRPRARRPTTQLPEE